MICSAVTLQAMSDFLRRLPFVRRWSPDAIDPPRARGGPAGGRRVLIEEDDGREA